jgi:hypothetical protein
MTKSHKQAAETIRETLTCEGLSLAVDRDAGVIRGVKVLGPTSRNGREYSADALRKGVGLYEGVRVNVNHVGRGESRGYGDRIGRLENAQVREGGIFADLKFNPKHALAEQLAWDAANAPGNVGLSHDAEGRLSRRNGKTLVEEILSVRSVDLVADPATTAGLFEDEGGDDAASTTQPQYEDSEMELKELTLDGLRTARPDLVESLTEQLRNGEEQKAKDAQIKTLQEQLATLTAAEEARKRDAAIAEALNTAGLDAANKTVCSELFLESLRAAPEDKRASLIEDRKQLVDIAPANGARPLSQSPHQGNAFPEKTSFVASLRG